MNKKERKYYLGNEDVALVIATEYVELDDGRYGTMVSTFIGDVRLRPSEIIDDPDASSILRYYNVATHIITNILHGCESFTITCNNEEILIKSNDNAEYVSFKLSINYAKTIVTIDCESSFDPHKKFEVNCVKRVAYSDIVIQTIGDSDTVENRQVVRAGNIDGVITRVN